MIGGGLKLGVLSNALNQNRTKFYYPYGVWCNIMDPFRDKCFLSKGEYVEKDSRAYDFYLSIREGNVIPM